MATNELQNKSHSRLTWIDFCKGIAMVGVIIDHCYKTFYTNIIIQHHTIFSVSLFVFIGGVTSVISLENSNRKYLINTLRRIVRILLPFLLALCFGTYINKKVNLFCLITSH